MNHHNLFTVSEFADLFNIHKKTLYYYDEIGLFEPKYTNEKGYRYYSDCQIYDFHVLLSLKNLNLSLKETKQYVNHRTPGTVIDLFNGKIGEIEEKIEELTRLKHSLTKRLALINSTLDTSVDDIQVQYKEEEYFRLEPIEPVRDSDTNYIAWHHIFIEESKHQLNEGAYGQMLLRENLIQNIYSPNYITVEAIEKKDMDKAFIKPEGKYVVGRKNGKVLHSTSLYQRLMKYIEENNLEIIGNAYEYFIIDGSFASDVNERVLEIQIQVK
ncbi:MerR family transcriptional regulator [Paenibacillus lentus]|nr:MerR family transcriptional regulator [Paenibacillus lentus]